MVCGKASHAESAPALHCHALIVTHVVGESKISVTFLASTFPTASTVLRNGIDRFKWQRPFWEMASTVVMATTVYEREICADASTKAPLLCVLTRLQFGKNLQNHLHPQLQYFLDSAMISSVWPLELLVLSTWWIYLSVEIHFFAIGHVLLMMVYVVTMRVKLGMTNSSPLLNFIVQLPYATSWQ